MTTPRNRQAYDLVYDLLADDKDAQDTRYETLTNDERQALILMMNCWHNAHLTPRKGAEV